MDYYLPHDVLADNILCRLPVKSIIRCIRVCKSWSSLITTSDFISLYHRRNNPKTLNPQILLHRWDDETRDCILLFDNEDYFHAMSLHLPYDYDPMTHMVGSVNGLICISIGQFIIGHVAKFILFNPLIGRFLLVIPPFTPKRDSLFPWSIKGLGFDETTQDYKILYMVMNCCFIYSLNSNRWRSLIAPFHVDNSHVNYNSVVFVNGGFHWLFSRSSFNFIKVFDVNSETFSEISLPKYLVNSEQGGVLRMMEFEKSSIAVIQQTHDVAHIWAMKECDSVQSWIKLATLNLEIGSLVLGLRNKDEVLIRLWKKYRVRKSGFIFSQNINNEEEFKNLMNIGKPAPFNFSRVFKYVPSLVLLDKQNNIDVIFNDVTPLGTVRAAKRRRREEVLELCRSKTC